MDVCSPVYSYLLHQGSNGICGSGRLGSGLPFPEDKLWGLAQFLAEQGSRPSPLIVRLQVPSTTAGVIAEVSQEQEGPIAC